MNGYWDDVDKEILDALAMGGPKDPADLARALGMSTQGVCSCLAMLAQAGKIRISSVEAMREPATLEPVAA
jgi:DNA-binding Lrp family transcriptional regulator